MVEARVLGVLAGGDMPVGQLASWARSASVVLAADGGANRLDEAGLAADATVGDLDSIDAAVRDRQRELVHDPGQDTTDADKLLALAAARGFRSITLAGVEGDQLDHVLATLGSVVRSGLSVRLALRTGIGWIVRPGSPRSVEAEAGARVSLLPIVPCEGVWLDGVLWPLRDSGLSMDGRLSVSNRATGATVSASVESGAALLVVGYPPEAMPRWDPA